MGPDTSGVDIDDLEIAHQYKVGGRTYIVDAVSGNEMVVVNGKATPTGKVGVVPEVRTESIVKTTDQSSHS